MPDTAERAAGWVFVAGPCGRCGAPFIVYVPAGQPAYYCRPKCARMARRRRAKRRRDPWGLLWNGHQGDRHAVESMCKGKRRLATEAYGWLVTERMAENGHAETPERLRAYRCPVCRAWHVGNVSRGPDKAAHVEAAAKAFRARLVEAGRLDELLAEWAGDSS